MRLNLLSTFLLQDQILTLWKSKSGKLRWFAKNVPTTFDSQNKSSVNSLEGSAPFKFHLETEQFGKEIKYIIDSLLPEGTDWVIFADTECYKSFLARDLAHALSYGGTFLGKYKVKRPMKVLYIDSELEEDFFHQYSNMALKGLGYKNGRKFDVHLTQSPENEEINLTEQAWRDFLDPIISQYDIIIFDCYYNLTNNKIKPTDFLNWKASWRKQGKVFITVDHANIKGDLQGGLDKHRNASLIIKLDNQADGSLLLSYIKARYLPKEQRVPMMLRPVFETDSEGNEVFRFDFCDANDVAVCVSDERKRTMLAHVLRDLHKLNVNSEICPLLGYADSTIYEWLKSFSIEENEAIQLEIYQNMSLEELKTEAKKIKKVK